MIRVEASPHWSKQPEIEIALLALVLCGRIVFAENRCLLFGTML